MEFDLARSVAVLERTPAVLRTLLAGLPEDWTSPNEGPDTWSPFDVVGHLIDGEELDWMERARIILAQDGQTFTPFDRFRHKRVNVDRSLADLLDSFAALRARNLADLEAMNLGPDHWKLTGEHPELGTVTLEQLFGTWVAHDLGHLSQITRVMAKQYGGVVGPWEAYLGILRR